MKITKNTEGAMPMQMPRLLLLIPLLVWSNIFAKPQSFEIDSSKHSEPPTAPDIPQKIGLLSYQKYMQQELLTQPNTQIKLVNINPTINKWFLLKIGQLKLHLENVDTNYDLHLSNTGINLISTLTKQAKFCELWDKNGFDLGQQNLDNHPNPYFPLCEGLLYVRLPRKSTTYRTITEATTELLRKFVFGETIINFVKPLIVARQAEQAHNREIQDIQSTKIVNQPLAAKIDQKFLKMALTDHSLGIKLADDKTEIIYGKWYATKMHKGTYISLITPEALAPEILNLPSLRSPDNDKLDSLVYLIAYDLAQYSAHFISGTNYPGVEKSPYDKSSRQFPTTAEPFALIGTVPPYMINQSIAVFIGGYKRMHGYFKYGPHKGKYDGFIESGTVLSELAPGLATFYTTKSGDLGIDAWPDNAIDMQKNIVSARQNGELIVANGQPGKYVTNWGAGNWSGSAAGNLRTLRSAICLQAGPHGKHLLFAAFTSATPLIMAKILTAYSCANAMQLDINAYMYLHNALFEFDSNKRIKVEYLHTEMEYPKGTKQHRYLMDSTYMDNNERDFFYVYRKH